jgi:transcriptional regulator with XRE-family HTH domain
MVPAGPVRGEDPWAPENIRSMHQEELGQLLEPYLGKTWSKASVSAVETGRRSLGPEELLAFARVLERPVGWFFRPSRETDAVEMPGGETFSASDLNYAVDGPIPEGPPPGAVYLSDRMVLFHGDERPPLPLAELLRQLDGQADAVIRVLEMLRRFAKEAE